MGIGKVESYKVIKLKNLKLTYYGFQGFKFVPKHRTLNFPALNFKLF